jgi:hypothetical protein
MCKNTALLGLQLKELSSSSNIKRDEIERYKAPKFTKDSSYVSGFYVPIAEIWVLSNLRGKSKYSLAVLDYSARILQYPRRFSGYR